MQIVQHTRRWTDEENNYIKKHYLEMSDEEMGKVLERTAKATRTERQLLDLRRPRKYVERKKNSPKPTFEDIKKMCEDKGMILLSDESEYINQSSNIRYICSKHPDKGEQTITVSHLKDGRGCFYCGREKTNASRRSKDTPEDDKRLCEIKEFEYIKTEKIGNYFYIFFICKKHRELGVQKMRRSNMNRAEVKGCQYCSHKNLPHWYVKSWIETLYPDFEVLSEYQGMNKPITCLCKKHGLEFTRITKDIINRGSGCTKCTEELRTLHSTRLSLDEVERRIFSKNPNVIILNLYDYTGFDSIMELKCTKCGAEWTQPFFSICANSCRCPICERAISLGEEKISNILSDKKILFIPQYKIEECRHKRPLLFDFGIVDVNDALIGLIEYQGEQHYKSVDYFGGEEKYKSRIERDKIKYDYCIANNIPLLRIPYWDINNIKNIVLEFLNKL